MVDQGPQQFLRMSVFYLTEPEKKGPICHSHLKKKINGLLGPGNLILKFKII